MLLTESVIDGFHEIGSSKYSCAVSADQASSPPEEPVMVIKVEADTDRLASELEALARRLFALGAPVSPMPILAKLT